MPVHVPVHLNGNGVLIQTGACYALSGLSFAATELSKNEKCSTVKGNVIVNGKIDKDIFIEMPVDKSDLSPMSHNLPKSDRDFLSSKSALQNGTLQGQLSKSHESVRCSVRKSLLASCLRNETLAALKCTSHRRRFSLGVCCLEFDLQSLGFQTSNKIVFSYKNNNIHQLDNMLGKQWDVFEVDRQQFRFVTELVIKMKGFILSGSVSTAICRKQLNIDSYREDVKSVDLDPLDGHDSDLDQEDISASNLDINDDMWLHK